MAIPPVRTMPKTLSLGLRITLPAAIALAVLAPCAAATADPTTTDASIAQVTQKLDKLARQSEMLTEKYDAVAEDVAAKQKAADQAKVAADKAVADYKAARAQLSSTIAAVYEGESFKSTGALLTSPNGSNLIDELNTLDVIGAHRSDLVSLLDEKKAAADKATAKAAATLHAAQATKADLAKQQKTVESSIASYKASLATLTAQQQAEYAARNAATQQQLAQTRAQAAQATANRGQAAQSGAVAPQARQAQSQQAVHATTAWAASGNAQAAVNFALAQVGKPYVFAASGPSAYDCSGLTMASWQQGGISLPHNAAAQYGYGSHVSVSQLQPGDLLFYYSPIGHVTIYVGNGMMVSAPQPGESVKLMPISAMMGDFVGATHLG